MKNKTNTRTNLCIDVETIARTIRLEIDDEGVGEGGVVAVLSPVNQILGNVTQQITVIRAVNPNDAGVSVLVSGRRGRRAIAADR